MRRKCEVWAGRCRPARSGGSGVRGDRRPHAGGGQLPTKASARAWSTTAHARAHGHADKIDLVFCSHYRCSKDQALWEERMQKLITGLGGLAAAMLTLSAANA